MLGHVYKIASDAHSSMTCEMTEQVAREAYFQQGITRCPQHFKDI